MAHSPNRHFVFSAILTLTFIFASLHFTGAQIGVAYGINGDRPLSPSQVVDLFHQYNIQKVRIYDPYPDILEALRSSGIGLTVGFNNDKLPDLAANADAWVSENILSYPDVQFKHIIVGNEVSPINAQNSQYSPYVLPAMQNIRAALDAANRGDISVTTAVETVVLDPTKNNPPSLAEFREEVKGYIDPIVEFLVETGAPIFANIYPYFAYAGNRDIIPFGYAFLDPDSGITAPDGLYYDNLYYAIVDTLNAALEKSTAQFSLAQNGGRRPPPKVKGGETGVPTEGADIATKENAQRYMNNLKRIVQNGTPLRPNRGPLETHVFSMFDESDKPGPEIERHFGLFSPNGQPKYNFQF